MKWKKFTLTTTTEAVDLVSSMFDDIGIEGIEIEDNIPLTEKETKGMFIDILPELPPDEGIAKVSFYLDDDADVAEMLKKVNEGLDELALFTDLGARTIEASETEDKDWINNWKQYFKPFTVDHILIKPTWELSLRSIRTSFWFRSIPAQPSARGCTKPPSFVSASWKSTFTDRLRFWTWEQAAAF